MNFSTLFPFHPSQMEIFKKKMSRPTKYARPAETWTNPTNPPFPYDYSSSYQGMQHNPQTGSNAMGNPQTGSYAMSNPQTGSYAMSNPQNGSYAMSNPQTGSYAMGNPQTCSYAMSNLHNGSYVMSNPQTGSYDMGNPQTGSYAMNNPHNGSYAMGNPQTGNYATGNAYTSSYAMGNAYTSSNYAMGKGYTSSYAMGNAYIDENAVMPFNNNNNDDSKYVELCQPEKPSKSSDTLGPKPTEVILKGFGPGRAQTFQGTSGTCYALRLNALSRGGKRPSVEAPIDEMVLEDLENEEYSFEECHKPKPREEKPQSKMVDLRLYKPAAVVMQEIKNEPAYNLIRLAMLTCQSELYPDLETYGLSFSYEHEQRLRAYERYFVDRDLGAEQEVVRLRLEKLLRELPTISTETFKHRFPNIARRVIAYDINGKLLRDKDYIGYAFSHDDETYEQLRSKLAKFRKFDQIKIQAKSIRALISKQRQAFEDCKVPAKTSKQGERFEAYLHNLKECAIQMDRPPKVLPPVRIRRKITEGSYANWTVGDENNLPTLLRYVWKGKLKKLIKYLKDQSKNHKINFQDDKGRTPLHYAASWGCIRTLKRLLQVPGIKLNKRDDEGKTPLYKAVEINSFECIKALIDAGANAKAPARDSRDALTAIMHFHGDEKFEMFKFLYEHGQYKEDKVEPYNMTLLHKAILADIEVVNLNIVKFLLDNGEDINAKEGNSRTPLHLAVHNRRPDLLYLLLAHEANIFYVDEQQKSAHDWTPEGSALRQIMDEFYEYGPAPINYALGSRGGKNTNEDGTMCLTNGYVIRDLAWRP